MEDKKEKTVYELELHETIQLKNSLGGLIEVTRVPGGWIYAFEYPGFRQNPIVFVKFDNEFVEFNNGLGEIIKSNKK